MSRPVGAPLILAFAFQPAPDTVSGQPACYACAADPAGPPCPRCGGTGQEPSRLLSDPKETPTS